MAVSESIHVSGFLNVSTESQEILPAIQGYENESLVSLENAVKPLIRYVPDVERMAQMAKDLCDAPEHGLTHDESSSILLYSMDWEPTNQSFSFILNTTLQRAGQEVLKSWFLYFRLLIAALVKLPSESSRFIVYRGLKIDLSAQLTKGNKIVWSAFSSCTMSLDVLRNERFLGSNGTRTLFVIDCYSGKKIRNHTFYPDEEEVLLFPGCQFEVMGCINENNGFSVVHLREIELKYTLISNVRSSTNNSQNVTLHTSTSPLPQQQEIISPAPIQASIVSMSLEERSPTSLLTQRSLAATARSILPSIQSSNNLVQRSTELPTKLASQLPALPPNVTQLPALPPNVTQQPIAEPVEQAQLPVTLHNNTQQPSKEKQTFCIEPVNYIAAY